MLFALDADTAHWILIILAAAILIVLLVPFARR